jgi:Zn-dependent protease
MDENYWQLGSWGRIPVAMHWTVLLAFAWMYLVFWSVPGTLVGAVALFLVMVVHELGHVAVLKRRKVSIDSITFFGIHGTTSHGYAGPGVEIAVAWAGVSAQAVLLAITIALGEVLVIPNPLLLWVWGVFYLVWTKLNVFVMVIALLPLGPFDGRTAWSVFGYMKGAMRRRKRRKQELLLNPERSLSPERRRELEESSSQAAADLLGKLSGRKEGTRTDE